jgi:hypothetical protein
MTQDFGKYKIKHGMLRWREGNSWIVASSKFDVISQGSTLEEAWLRWTSSFAFMMLHHNIEAPPPDILTQWLIKHEQCNISLDHKLN